MTKQLAMPNSLLISCSYVLLLTSGAIDLIKFCIGMGGIVGD